MVATKEKESKSEIPIPEWLTEDVFIELLKNDFKEFKEINDFKVVPAVATGENYMTLLLRIEMVILLSDNSEHKISYLTKILPSSKELRSIVNSWKVFQKEKNTYSYLSEFEQLYREAGKTIIFSPKVYESKKLESDIQDEMLILEDLRPRGFKNVNRQNGLDMEHTKAVLEKMAQFHAASACLYEKLGSYPVLYNSSLYSEKDIFGEYRASVRARVLECLDLCDADYIKDTLKIYSSSLPDMFQYSTSNDDPNEFRVLNHGDAWSNNFMFQYDDSGNISETYFVDFQMSRYTSPAQDLNYLLLSSVCLDLKISHFDYFIQFYHKKLIEHLQLLNYKKKLPSLKDLHISLLKHGDWAYTAIATVMPLLLLDQSDNANLDNVIKTDKDGEKLKKLLYLNPRYVEHMKQIFPWLYYRGLLEYTK